MNLTDPESTDVDGHGTLAKSVPGGAFLFVDLDGLPSGDGQVLVVMGNGTPEDVDAMAAARRIAELVISRM